MGTTPDRCPTATPQCLTATPLTLLASSPRSWRRLTGVLASPPRTPPSSSSPGTPPSSSCSPASHVRRALRRVPSPWKVRRQGHEADRCCRCHQGHHPQGGCWKGYQGRREGQQEEVRSCSGATWGVKIFPRKLTLRASGVENKHEAETF